MEKAALQLNNNPMPLTAWVNGQFIPLEHATVHIEDRGFQFADGVYEVIACFGGTFLDLEAHLQRLERSCQAIDIRLPKPRQELEQLIIQTYQRNPYSDAMLYIQITRGTAARAHLVTHALNPTMVITSRALPIPTDEKITQGLKAITLHDIRWKRCDIKSIALLASVLGKQEANRQGADEAFWLDDDDHMLEGCATNCFAVIDHVLVTHPLDHQVLGGITRDMALNVAKEQGIAIEERQWKLNEANLSECMMSSTTNAIMPVCQINDHTIGTGKPGPIATLLRHHMLKVFDALKSQNLNSGNIKNHD